MSRLIDADKLIKRLNEKALAQHDIPLVEHDFRELIHDAPTVDAEDVVRCEDCVWANFREREDTGFEDAPGVCMNPYTETTYTAFCDYCPFGERKDDEHK